MTPTSVRLPSGLWLSCIDHGPRNGRAMLFLHGIADSSFSFSTVLPLLPSGVRAVVPDQRGHGDSDRPSTGYSMNQLATDALELLDELRIPSAVVVGHSMGSFVAQRLAVLAPHRVTQLVLIGSAARPSNNVVIALRDAVADLADPVPDTFAREFQLSTIHRPLAGQFVDRVVAESLKVPARVWRACTAGMLKTELPRLTCPCLVLWGDRDSVFSRADQSAILQRVPGAKLRVAADVGHAYHWEAPRHLVSELEAFLSTDEATQELSPAPVLVQNGSRHSRFDHLCRGRS